ncbi:MAG: amidohydrolase family protein [Sulfolobales archaeon]
MNNLSLRLVIFFFEIVKYFIECIFMKYLIEASAALIGEELEIRRNISIYIEDGEIKSIGLSGFSTDSSTKKISLKRGVIMPSLVNAHIHSADIGFEEFGWDLDIDSVVGEPYGLKYHLLNIYEEQVKNFIKRSLELSLKSGVLVVNDFRENGLRGLRQGLEAAEDIKWGIEYIPSYMPIVRGDDYLDLEEIYEASKYTKWIGISSPHYYTPENLKKIDSIAEMRNLWIISHVAETRDVREERDFELIKDLRRLKAVVHGIYLSSEDLYLLKERGIALILCPRSNMWFGSGIVDLRKIFSAEITLGLGTDNSGWIKPDIWREIEFLIDLLRIQGLALDPREILKIATVDSARIFGIRNVIEEGGKARFIGLQSEWINTERTGNIYLSIAKRGGPESLRLLVNDRYVRII